MMSPTRGCTLLMNQRWRMSTLGGPYSAGRANAPLADMNDAVASLPIGVLVRGIVQQFGRADAVVVGGVSDQREAAAWNKIYVRGGAQNLHVRRFVFHAPDFVTWRG